MESEREILWLEREIQMLQMKCTFRLLGGEPLHPGQTRILRMLDQMGDCSQSDLAKAMHISPASVGVSIKRLEKAGLVERQADEKDLRYNKVTLSAQGKEVTRMAEDVMYGIAARKLSGFTPEELEELSGFFKRIRENLVSYKEELSTEKGEKH